MRTLALLFLTIEFVVAVILPNEIGTHELPAVKGSLVSRAGNHTVEPAARGGFDACLNTAEFFGFAPTGRCQSSVSHFGLFVRRQQGNLPLLI
jgi:hypothetical protein